MANTHIEVKLLSPTAPLATVKAKGLSVPGILGYMEILPGHASLVSEIGVGVLSIEGPESSGDPLIYFVHDGYIQVDADKVTVLADVVEKVDQIDRARAEKARDRAIERLTTRELRFDLGRAQRALQRAHGRLAFLESVAFHRKAGH